MKLQLQMVCRKIGGRYSKITWANWFVSCSVWSSIELYLLADKSMNYTQFSGMQRFVVINQMPDFGLESLKVHKASQKWLKSGLAAFFGLGLWQSVAILVQNLRQIHFPDPWDCFLGLWQMLAGVPFLNHTIYEHVLASGGRWLTGFGVAWIFALLWAFLAYWYPAFKAITRPTVEVLQLIPGLAWVPVVILLFGLGPHATLAIIILTTFPVMALSGIMGFAAARPEHVCIGRACGYGFWGLFYTVYLPSAIPQILSGTRIALGVSWRVLVAAEMVVGSGEGLGYAIIQSRWTMDYVSAFACIIIIALAGLGIERLCLLPLEKKTLRRWGINHEHFTCYGE